MTENRVDEQFQRQALETAKPLLVKRVQYNRYGGPKELQIEDVALPEPGSGQIRVRVRAAAANPMDWKIRKGELQMMTGRKFPRGLGHDFAGVVEAVGPNVSRFKINDEVFGAAGLKESGAFAEALIADEKMVFSKPQSLSFAEAAAMPIVSATAWTALMDKAKLRAGQRVFISGCLGGVGRIAVQIARMRDAKIVGSCGVSQIKDAISMGVHEVIDYRVFDAKKHQGCFDVIFDTHGSLSIRQCDAMLKQGGMALHVVPTPLKMIWSMLSRRHQTIFAQLTPEGMIGIAEAIDQGKLSPTIGRTVPLAEAIPAISELEKTGLPKGKLVIIPTL